jgi:hypothetical protein
MQVLLIGVLLDVETEARASDIIAGLDGHDQFVHSRLQRNGHLPARPRSYVLRRHDEAAAGVEYLSVDLVLNRIAEGNRDDS